MDKKIIASNFSRAAKDYSEAASVQKIAAQKLCAIAAPFIKDNSQILDLGAGTGFISDNLGLLADKKNLQLFEVDLSSEMLEQKRRFNSIKIKADFENLPFENRSFDMLISSFSLQWMSDFEKGFSQFSALLKPHGVFVFCIPTHGSLKELTITNIININNFPKIAELKTIASKNSFEELFHQEEVLKQHFDDALSAINSLKKVGANYAKEKTKKPLTKTSLKHLKTFSLKNLGSENRGAVANPRFFEEFLGKTVCEKVSVLDIRALEQTGLTKKLPKKMDLQQCRKSFDLSWSVSYLAFRRI